MYSSHQCKRLSIMAILGCLPFSVNGAVESMPLMGGVYNSAHVFKHQITNSLSYSTRLTRDTALFTIAGLTLDSYILTLPLDVKTKSASHKANIRSQLCNPVGIFSLSVL